MNSAEQVRLLAGRYRLDEAIGHGGMGTVWRARDELLSRDVAVKEIVWQPRLSDTERETARRRAIREAQMAARLNHPNVVGIYDIVEQDGRPWIVMELVPYRRLESIRYPQAERAADWEFTYDRDGMLVHILNRNVLANGKRAYALYWSTPESYWNAYYRYFQAFAATFRPAA